MSNREYRSDVFSMLMEYPEYALDVYKALGGKKDALPSMVEIRTLEKGISLSVRNDAAFIIDTDLNLYEHQSTYNPNMPLRSLLYLAETLKSMFKGRDLYGRRLIEIPKPKFVVFYNGEATRPEVEIQKLSTAYAHAGDERDSIELICTVYNINPEKNEAILSASYVLDGYMIFVNKVREYRDANDERGLIVEKAVNYCIENHILENFFKERKEEVIKYMTIDMTFEAREKIFRKEEREEGRAEAYIEMYNNGLISREVAEQYIGSNLGNIAIDMTFEAREKIFRKEEREEGREEGRAEGRLGAITDFVNDGLCSVEEGARRAGMSVDDFEAIIRAKRS